MMRTINTSKGFSLVELMIAIVLGLILMLGVMQIFLGNRQTQTTEQSVARVQESGRLALDFIEDDLRVAGFYGTGAMPGGISTPSIVNRVADPNFDHFDNYVNNAVRVYSRLPDGTWSPAVPDDDIPVAAARNGSDVIAVYYAYDTGAEIGTGPAFAQEYGGSDDITITRNTADCFNHGDLVMLSNPGYAVIFQVSNTPNCADPAPTLKHDMPENKLGSLGSAVFNHDTRIMKLAHRVYYVRDTQRDNPEGNPVFALYRVANGNTDELVEGVEVLRAVYGQNLLDGAGEPTGQVRYVGAATVNNRAIKSARLGILVQGLDPVRPDNDTRTYDVVGTLINNDGAGFEHSGGRTLRRVFTANVELRNRTQ